MEKEQKTETAGISKRKVQAAKNKRDIIRYGMVLFLLFFLTNPSMIPFIPANTKAKMTAAITSIFGDVTQTRNVISWNWIVIFQLITMILIVIVATSILKWLSSRMNATTNRRKTLLTLFESTIHYASVLVGIFWGLALLGVNISTLFASIGILALIVGFGAESLIEDVITGIFMLFENQYNVGDIIEVGDFRGIVDQIGIRTTSIRDAGDNIKIINNAQMKNILNRSDKPSKAVCDVHVPYDVDLKIADAFFKEHLSVIKNRHNQVFIDNPIFLGVQSLGEKALTLRVVATVSEKDIFDAIRILNRELKDGLEEAGIRLTNE